MKVQQRYPVTPHITKNTSVWFKIAWAYQAVPGLKHINPVAFPVVFFSIFLASLNRNNPCTCADQIPDVKLEKMAKAGNLQVQRYLKKTDNTILCAARRAELLKQLKRKKPKE